MLYECPHTQHKFALSFTCFTCNREFHEFIILKCKAQVSGLRTFVCKVCKDKQHGAIMFTNCRPGTFDTWNNSGWHDRQYTSQAHIENVDNT